MPAALGREDLAIALVLEHVEEAAARPLDCAEALEVLGVNLAVDEPKAPGLELPDEAHEDDLGCIGREREHRLTTKDRTDGDTVDSTDELVVESSLGTVGVSELVEAFISVDHVAGDPGSVLIGAGDRGAALDDRRERGVEGQAIGLATNGLA